MAVAMRYGTPGESSGGAGGSTGGGYSRDLLWTNPSPTTNFSAKTISVDLSDYSWFAVEIQFQTSQNVNPALQEFRVDEVQKLLVLTSTSNNRTGGRHITWNATAKTLTFDGATYNGASNNSYCIPLRIYGIKF